MEYMSKIDILGVGDITTDAFITLKEAEVNCNIDSENCQISMRWGDKIPFEKATIIPAVGNSVNASISCSRLGFNSALLSFVGNDPAGHECIDILKKEGVDTQYMSVQDNKTTNYHYVLSYQAERTILVKHEEFEYELPEIKETPKFIYLSSLAENSIEFHHTIVNYAVENNVKLVFQPGTFQMKLGYEKLKFVYEASELFFCNKEEAQLILKSKDASAKSLLKGIYEMGVKIPIVTDGVDGCYMLYDGNTYYLRIYPDIGPPVERTGAGDSFSSTFTSFYANGMDPLDALLRAPINSMSVIQYIGAREGLLSKDEIEDYLKKAPDNYKLEKL